MEQIYDLIEDILENDDLIYGVFSNVKSGVEKSFKKLTVKPVVLKKEKKLHFEYTYDKQVKHENLNNPEGVDIIYGLMSTYFKQGVLYTIDADYQILISKKGKAKILKKPPSRNTFDMSHNRKKNYIIEENKPCSFLHALGVMNEEGKVLSKMYDKFRQINRYLEMVADCVPHLKSDSKLHIVDFGCGKAYLTFALYYYLVDIEKLDVEIIGLDLKKEVINNCQKLADRLNYKGLTFIEGDIKNYNGLSSVDMVVSLHACDTATDESLAKAIAWDADVILAVPCCQHELFKKIHNSNMEAMTKHGLIKERLSSLITDSIRGNVLEIMGYHTQILEFIDMEHTPKNILIRAYKTNKPNPDAKKEYLTFKEFWHVEPYIEQAIGEAFKKRIED